MKLVFISGAFRARTAWDITENVRAAERAGLEVAKAGAMPIIPHANTAHFHGQLTDEFWLAGTMELLKRSDAIYVFDVRHLTSSTGTRSEVSAAKTLGLPVFKDIARLREWVRG